jgi:Domain of unknown function (DUF4411)
VAEAALFSIDTSSLIYSYNVAYPPDVFPTFWTKFEQCVEGGVIVASHEVYLELERKADDLFAWAKEHKAMFEEITDETQECVARMLQKHPKLVDIRTTKSAGDPWVIAVAQCRTPNLAVVTQERPSGGPNRVKIPQVCSAEKIACLSMLDLVRTLRWQI